jgi:hypothetical protein
MNKMESRHLEILVTGVQDRKNHNKNPFFDTMEVGQYCDGLAFTGEKPDFPRRNITDSKREGG